MNSTYPAVRHAFTLIEMMIAVALGTLVVYVAFSGLRSAAQAISSAQRLSTENTILRAGMVLALQDNDLWLSHDDPLDCTRGRPARPGAGQLLRGTSSAGSLFQGLPFTPFLASTEFVGSGARMLPGDMAVGADESPTGWDPNAWGAHESRGWAWGNLVERIPIKRLVQKTPAPESLPVRDMNGNLVYFPTHSFVANDRNRTLAKRRVFGVYCNTSSTRSTSPHRWQQRQLHGLKRTLGSYGLFEYLPSNTPLMTYSDRNSVTTGLWTVAPEWCGVTAGKDGYYLGTDDRTEGINFALDVYGVTAGTVYAPANPYSIRTSATSAPLLRTIGEARDISSRRYGTGISLDAYANNDTVTSIERLLKEAEVNRPILDASNSPSTWPTLNVSTLRHRRSGASVCLHRITWTSPLTGAQTEFTFTAFGTTLRGARQQRLRDEPGWVDPFPTSGTPKPNLDSYVP